MRFQKSLRNVIIGATGFLFSLISADWIVTSNVNESISPYIKNNLSRIISEQEEKIGIQHFGTPKISRKLPPGCWGFLGCYRPKEDTIHLAYGGLITPENNLTNNLANTLADVLGRGRNYNVERALNHELGHFYTDKLNESLGKGDWLDFPDRKLKDDRIGTMLIAEGVATYFSKVMDGEEDNFKDSDWPNKLNDFWLFKVMYGGGHHLVKPIIDKHKKEGIVYLIENPPTVDELKDLPDYQKRALEYLSNK